MMQCFAVVAFDIVKVHYSEESRPPRDFPKINHSVLPGMHSGFD